MKTTLTILILLTVFPLNIFANFSYTSLEGHSGDVHSVVFSPDGQRLASGSVDNTIRLWDAETGNHLHTLEGHWGRVYSVVFSPDGQRLASGSVDNTIRLWDAETGNHLHTLEGQGWDVHSVVFSPDGQRLASGGEYFRVRLWDVSTGSLLQTLRGHGRNVHSVVFSPDGQRLASGGEDSTVRLWDVSTGSLLQTLRGHRYSVHSVVFSPDGQRLASGSADNTVRLWDVSTGSLLQTLRGHRYSVHSVVFSPDGQRLASGSADNTVRLWDVSTGSLLQTLRGHRYSVHSVVFSPDGQRLASGSADNTVRLWKIPDTDVRITPSPVVSPAISERFTIRVGIVEGENVGGYQMSLEFDPDALRYVESANGDYLPSGAFFVPPVVSENKVTLGATSLAGVSNGDGTLATVTFEVVEVKKSAIAIDETILTDSAGEHLPHWVHSTKVEPSLLTSSAVISLIPASVLSPAVGDRFIFNLDITGGQNIADFQFTFDYDGSALEFISTSRGNYLANGVGSGDGTLKTVTFEVREVKASTVSISGYLIAPNGLRYTPTLESAKVVIPLLGDVNRDGVVNILDLVQVASSFGQPVPKEGNPADVNEDGIVNIVDLVKVAGALGDGAAAPSAWHPTPEAIPTRADVQQWLSLAQHLNLTDPTSQRGIIFLQNLLAVLTPKETALLPNYPNPFNPETWIPYQLAKPADVTLTIYASDGTVVRTLALGHQPVGIYQGKSRAAYWDGKNALGEPVASGVYFYTLAAGEFTATRKMLIRK